MLLCSEKDRELSYAIVLYPCRACFTQFVNPFIVILFLCPVPTILSVVLLIYLYTPVAGQPSVFPVLLPN